MTFFNKKPKVKTPIESVEEAMKLINQACYLLEDAIKDHPVGPSFKAGMVDALRSCITPNIDLNKGTLPLLITVLKGERKVPIKTSHPAPKVEQ